MMKSITEIFEALQANFPEDVQLIPSAEKPAAILVSPLKIHLIAQFLNSNENFLFDSLILLSGVDDVNGKKVTAENGSFRYEGGTFSVYYHLESTSIRHKVVLVTRADRGEPNVESVSAVWRGADWHEREAYDMFGIKFLNHPNLIRILMPYDWEEGSHPLRKDYQNPEFYKGMKVV